MDSAATHHGSDYGSYSTGNFINRTAGGRHWGDEIANSTHRFDTTQITVDRNDATSSMRITLRTMFDGSDLGAKYADIFLDVNTPDAPDSFGYAIALGHQTQDPGLTPTVRAPLQTISGAVHRISMAAPRSSRRPKPGSTREWRLTRRCASRAER